jgi:hypothetical protein
MIENNLKMSYAAVQLYSYTVIQIYSFTGIFEGTHFIHSNNF